MTEHMTHKELMLAAIRRQPVDIVPHCTYNCHRYYESHQLHRDSSYDEIVEKVNSTAGVMIKIGTGRGNAISLKRYHEKFEQDGDLTTLTTTLTTPKGDLISERQNIQGQPSLMMVYISVKQT